MEPAIKVHNLYRFFGNIRAVNGVSFEIDPGQVIGFVGANGAGKTTTMRILATLEHPSAGDVWVGGIHVIDHPSEVRRIIGWMPDSFGTYDHMTVIEYLDFYARALGYKGSERSERIEEVIEFTDLAPIRDRLINTLSKGMGQRLCLGRALVHDPQILIMDEPAAGLDPRARVELKQLIRILAEEGKTIFISSHILGELQEMCDSLLFINQGRIIHQGSAEDLLEASGEKVVIEVQLAGGREMLGDWAAMTPHVRVMEETRKGGRLEIDEGTPDRIADVLRRMVSGGLQVVDFHREQRRLEDAFIEILGKIEQGEEIPAVSPPPLPGTPPQAATTAPAGARSLPPGPRPRDADAE